MQVGILGSGDVAKSLAKGFLNNHHEVMLGTRTPAKLEAWLADYPAARAANFNDTAEFAELLVLAVKGSASSDVLASIDATNLNNKTVIDATNPIADTPPVNGVLNYFTQLDNSLMEQLQRDYPQANFVKAFNSVGNALMVNPQFEQGRPTMFICGNSEPSKQKVSEILEQFGWDTADMGKAEAARAIEPLCMLWCIPGFLQNQWSHAFKLLTK